MRPGQPQQLAGQAAVRPAGAVLAGQPALGALPGMVWPPGLAPQLPTQPGQLTLMGSQQTLMAPGQAMLMPQQLQQQQALLMQQQILAQQAMRPR